MKSILLACVACSAGFSLRGELLYWMVEDSTASQIPYAFASVKDVTGGGYLDYVDEEGATWPGSQRIDASAFSDGSGVYADVGNSSAPGRSFLIELFNDSGARVAWGETFTYEQLVGLGAIGHSAMEREKQPAWTGGAFTAVPEPSSGLLVLAGLAGFALKRRNAV